MENTSGSYYKSSLIKMWANFAIQFETLLAYSPVFAKCKNWCGTAGDSNNYLNITKKKKKESQAPSPFISYKKLNKSQGQVIKNNILIYECTFCIAQPYGTKIWSHITSSVNQLQPADLIGGLSEGLVTVAENSKADGQNTVSYSLGVRPGAGV